MKLLIVFIIFFSFSVYAKEETLLCIPEKEEYKYVDSFLKNTEIKDADDWIVIINENEFIIEDTIGRFKLIRQKPNGDPNLTSKFFMVFASPKEPKKHYIVFYKQSGRLIETRIPHYINEEFKRHYQCSKYTTPVY